VQRGTEEVVVALSVINTSPCRSYPKKGKRGSSDMAPFILNLGQWRTQEFFFGGWVSTNSVGEDRENGDLVA